MSVGDVAVVGAGPVGLCAAVALADAGFPVTVVEAGSAPSPEWRASTFHPPTLEHLEPLGVVDEMLSLGLRADRYQIRDRARGVVAEFDYRAIAGDTRYPFRLQLEQYKFVELMLRRLERFDNAQVLFQHRVSDLTHDDDAVRLELSTPHGATELRAAYVVGADGASSTIRSLLKVPFEGWTYAQRFLLISTDLPFEEHMPDLCSVNYIADPDEFVMLLRTPDIWRVLVPVPEGMFDEHAVEERRMQQILEGVVGTPVDWTEVQVPQHQIYRVHQRVAETFRRGRVVLAGDAAHVNSPIGGFGLNSGLHDVLDLAQRLRRIRDVDAISSRARADAELATYSHARRAVALEHIRKMSDRNTRTLVEQDEETRLADQRELGAVATDPEAARQWLLDASMISAVRHHGIGVEPRRGRNADAAPI